MSEREESDGQTQKKDHIDERKLAEELLHKSEEHFRLITDNMEDEIWLMDMDMNVTFLTPSVQRYRGFSLEDMQKMDWTEHLTPESLEVAIKALELALTPENLSQKDREVTGTQDLEYYCKDGSTVWSETTIKLLRNENGEPVGLLGVAHDITERKQAEEALRESEAQLEESNQLLSGVLEHTHMMAVFLDTQFNFIWVNRAYADTCKQEPSFFPGKNHFDLYPHEENQAIFQRVVDTAEPFFVASKPFEFSDQPKRGMTYWDWSLIPAKDSTGKVTGLVFTLAEVTERIRAEEALRESEEQFRTFAENTPGLVVIYDIHPDGQRSHVYLSPGLIDMFGEVTAEYIGNKIDSFFELIHPDDLEGLLRASEETEAASESFDYEYRVRIVDTGEYKWVRSTGIFIPLDDEVNRWQGQLYDITDRKKAEELQRVLLDIANSINSCENLDELYPIIHHSLSQILETTNFFIALYNKDHHTLSFPYYVDEQDEYEMVSAEKTNCHYIIRTGEALLADREVFADLNARGEIVTIEELSRPLIWLGAPLKRGDEVFGVVAVQSYTDSQAFNENDKEILQLVSHQIANAIDEVKAEEALKESEEKFRTVFENTMIGLYRTTPDGQMLMANQALCWMLGYTSVEELQQHSLEERGCYAPEYSRDEFKCLVEKEGIIVGLESKWVRKDGSVLSVRENARAIRDDAGNILHYEGNVENITERKKAEESLKESEEKFRNFFEHARDIVFMTDKDGNITNINIAGCLLFGHSLEEMVGMNVYDFYADPDDKALLMELIEDQGSIAQFEVQLLGKDRTIMDCLLTCSVKRDSDGNVTGYNGNIHNISRFRQVENERNKAFREILKANLKLRESEEKYRTLFMIAPEGITVVGLDGTILDCNDRAGEIGGRTKGEVVGKNFLELGVFDEDNAEDVMELFRKRLNGEEVGPVELPITVNGKIKWIDVFHAPLYRDEDLYALYIISRDVTERKLAEENIRAEHRRAEFYNDLMAHDINNLNQGAMSNLELLMMSAELSEKGRKYAKGALGQVTGSANLISNLKKLSELEHKDGKRVNMDIVPVLQEAVDHIHSLFPGRQVEIRHNLTEKKYLVKGNELLFDIFSNLLNNAVKYDRHDSVIVDVHISETDDDYLKMEFKDRGPGIEDNSKKAIFDRLKREDETIQGSGLGLMLVRYIINNIGGRVWVEDRVEGDRAQGSNFVLLISRGD